MRLETQTHIMIWKRWARQKSEGNKKKINHIYYYLLSSYFLLQFQQFVKENLSGKSRILTQAIESVKTNTNWMDLNYETIVEWLRNATRS